MWQPLTRKDPPAIRMQYMLMKFTLDEIATRSHLDS
jgi:hypothetical protein